MKTRFNVIVFPKHDSESIYNRIYKNFPSIEQTRGCVKRYKKTRNTNTYNGVDIRKIQYKNGKQVYNEEVK